MAKPVDGPDDWWLAVLWVTDDEGVVSFRDVAPARGPAARAAAPPPRAGASPGRCPG